MGSNFQAALELEMFANVLNSGVGSIWIEY